LIFGLFRFEPRKKIDGVCFEETNTWNPRPPPPQIPRLCERVFEPRYERQCTGMYTCTGVGIQAGGIPRTMDTTSVTWVAGADGWREGRGDQDMFPC
jgi:hypothetical protein